jgi:hypothetical protein
MAGDVVLAVTRRTDWNVNIALLGLDPMNGFPIVSVDVDMAAAAGAGDIWQTGAVGLPAATASP